ncbi:MAG: beta-lactamase family protein [Gemmatimonadales bacterium]|nr:beta-lactamase family protein [Gemmatimonadales bacterium]
MLRTVVLLVSLLVVMSSACVATPVLKVGEELAGALTAGGEAAYSLELGTEYFVYGAAMQKSVDVIITVTGPDGAEVGVFDVSGEGLDYFQFQSTIEGLYGITIKPFEDGAGEFSVLLYMTEALAETPAGKVDQLMVRYANDATPGAIIAVVEDGEISFQKAYGMANLSHGIPLTTTTITNIGSTSKQFTAFAINLLVKEGKLSFDDDVRKYLPEVPDFGETVTIGHLLSHTSGYREYLNGIAMSGRMLDEGDYIDRDEILALVMRQPELQNSPGAEWNYCNTGYSLLALIVERITEKGFDVWMKEKVFGPLGMGNTQVRMHRSSIIKNSAQGYVAFQSLGFREVPDISASVGAGGIYTTVADLALWMKNLHSGEVGGKEVIEKMTTPLVLTDGDESAYGMGLVIDEFQGLRRIQHGGGDSAHRSTFAYFPEIDKGVITLSNNGSYSRGIADKVVEAFFAENLTPAETLAETQNEFDASNYQPEGFDEIVGRFELEGIDLILTFSREDDVFYCQATGQPRTTIVPTANLEFNIEAVDAAINFHRGDDGDISSLTLHQGAGITGNRLADEAWVPDAEEMATYTGRYFSNELEAFYEIVVDGDDLVLKHRRFSDAKLQIKKKDVFLVASPLRELSFVRSDEGILTGFAASNGRTRGVFFERVN